MAAEAKYVAGDPSAAASSGAAHGRRAKLE